MPHRTTILIAFTTVLVLALLIWSFRPQPVLVDPVRAEAAQITVSVREQAYTRVKDRFEISAPVAGYAPRFELEVGDSVEAGQALLELQPLPSSMLDPRARESAEVEVARAEAALASAEATLQARRADAELAERELRRLEPLFERGTISASQLDQAAADSSRAAAELRAAESGLEVARQSLRYAMTALRDGGTTESLPDAVVLRAPVAGRVLEVSHKSAGVVQPGQKLMCIADPLSLEVVAEVLTADAVRIQPGMVVELERWGGERPLDGRVRRIEPAGFTKVSALGVEEQRTRVIIDLVGEQARWVALGDGYRVEARFILSREDVAVSVPNSALFRHDGGMAVFVVEEGRARLRPVRTGLRGELRTPVLAGLDAGQTVVDHPAREIEHGARVRGYRDSAR